MKFVITLVLLLIANTATAITVGCGKTDPDDAITKQYVAQAVSNTEKQEIVSVDISASGLALVRYGKNGHYKSVRVTYVFQCDDKATPEQVIKNPLGFRVTGYSPITK